MPTTCMSLTSLSTAGLRICWGNERPVAVTPNAQYQQELPWLLCDRARGLREHELSSSRLRHLGEELHIQDLQLPLHSSLREMLSPSRTQTLNLFIFQGSVALQAPE